MILKKIALFIAILATVSQAQSGIREVGNGGHSTALEFQSTALAAIQEAEADPKLKQFIMHEDLKEILKVTQILVSDSPIYALKDNVKQESTAINYQKPQFTIVVNRVRWNEIQSPILRKALALHEVLSLAQIETTGQYSISGAYLESHGVRCAESLCSLEDISAHASVSPVICIGQTDDSKSLYDNSELIFKFFNSHDEIIREVKGGLSDSDAAPFGNVINSYFQKEGSVTVEIHFVGEQPAFLVDSYSSTEKTLSFNNSKSAIEGLSCYNIQ